MGCDIHLHVEIKVDGEWLHYNHPSINQDYSLFAKMAGVRRYDREITPISDPRGMPLDATKTTVFDCNYDGAHAHSHSWLGLSEIADLCAWYRSLESCPKIHGPEGTFGYLLGNSWEGAAEFPDEYPIEDARFVFWFDN